MAKTKKSTLAVSVVIPQGVTANFTEGVFTAQGPAGEVSKKLMHPLVLITVSDGTVTLAPRKKGSLGAVAKMYINTYRAHVRNILAGVVEPFVYELKICSGHFPMSVALKGNVLEVKNFLGEKVPRRVSLDPAAKVVVAGEKITVTCVDKELAGQTAARIEQLCRISNRDRRVFMDGLWIVNRAGREVMS